MSIRFEPDRGQARLLYAGREETPKGAPTPPLTPILRLAGSSTATADHVICGDLLEIAGTLSLADHPKARLAYLDPPFDTGRPWLARTHLRGPNHQRGRVDIEHAAYEDTWTGDAYLSFIHARMRAARELLHPEGVMVVHCDSRRSHHLRTIGEEVMGDDSLINEVVWRRRPGRTNTGRRLDRVTDRLLMFCSAKRPRVALPRTTETERAKQYIAERFRFQDGEGRRYMTAPLSSPNPRPNLRYVYNGHEPPPNGWAVSREKMVEWDRAGRLHFVQGGRIYRKVFLDEYKGQPISDLWTDVPVVNAMSAERTGFPTQKPEALLRRIVEMFTEEGELVLDAFAGSGTCSAVARTLGRGVLAIDRSREAAARTWIRMARIAGPALLQSNVESPSTPSIGTLRCTSDNEFTQISTLRIPDLEQQLQSSGFEPASPLELVSALAVGERRGGVLHVHQIDAPTNMAELITPQWPQSMGPDVLVWDLLYRTLATPVP